MSSYGSLPVTGATVAIGGLVFDQVWLLAAAVAIVGVGATMARIGFRRGKTPMDV